MNTGRCDSDHHPIETVLCVDAHVVVAPVRCAGRALLRVHWLSGARDAYACALRTKATPYLEGSVIAADASDVSAAFASMEQGKLHATDISGMPARARRPSQSRRAHQPFFDAECQALKRGLRMSMRHGPPARITASCNVTTIALSGASAARTDSSS